jgi:hypothetical protein
VNHGKEFRDFIEFNKKNKEKPRRKKISELVNQIKRKVFEKVFR